MGKVVVLFLCVLCLAGCRKDGDCKVALTSSGPVIVNSDSNGTGSPTGGDGGSTAAVPEPNTIGLLVLGLGGILITRRMYAPKRA